MELSLFICYFSGIMALALVQSLPRASIKFDSTIPELRHSYSFLKFKLSYTAERLYHIRTRCDYSLNPSVLAELSHCGILRYRGCRGGRNLQRRIETVHRVNNRARPETSVNVTSRSIVRLTGTTQPQGVAKPDSPAKVRSAPTLYVLNAAAITKPHALQQLTADITGYSIDVALISESHLKHKHLSDSFNINNFSLFRRDRSGRRGGGVLIYARETLSPTLWKQNSDNDLVELLWIRAIYLQQTYFFGCIYHPPKPLYQTDSLLDIIENSINDIQHNFPNAIITLAGDFNQLLDSSIQDKTGLIPIVNEPTRGNSFLDRIYTSDINYDNIKIVNSCVRSDHFSIVAYSGESITCYNKSKRICQIRRRSPEQKAAFLSSVTEIDLDAWQTFETVQEAFDSFYFQVLGMLDRFFPLKSVTLTDREPPYITPALKLMLRKKNSLMRKGRVGEAGALASKIGAAIVQHNAASFSQCNHRVDSGDMWQKVRQLLHTTKANAPNPNITAVSLNTHFTNISTDSTYHQPLLKATAKPQTIAFSDLRIFNMLDTLSDTATGLDKFPAWFLRLAAPVISTPLAYLVNTSLLSSSVPTQWKSACITPLPKVPQPLGPSDFRPISITPVLSRLFEKAIVRQYLYPSFSSPTPNISFSDQFAFRPTGSTTAALISILHSVTNLLAHEPYVHLIALDFSKAFDSVRHSTLFHKMSQLNLPDHVYNWLVDYFQDHSQCTKYGDSVSPLSHINASVIQGSAIGPASFLVCSSDLRPLFDENVSNKYADDLYLIIPASNSHTCSDEIHNVAKWAQDNNLKLNTSKSLEMIITNSRKKQTSSSLPPLLPSITRVNSMVVLGVTLSNNLKMDKHISEKIKNGGKSLFALKTLKAHGMPPNELQEIFRATALGSLLYAAPAWWGFISAEDLTRLESYLKRSKKAAFYPSAGQTITDIVTATEATLFVKVFSNPSHVLYPLLPQLSNHPYNLRPRTHPFTIPQKSNSLVEKNYLNRLLRRDSY